jgi:hypothetical protein
MRFASELISVKEAEAMSSVSSQRQPHATHSGVSDMSACVGFDKAQTFLNRSRR